MIFITKAWHSRGQRFDPAYLHQRVERLTKNRGCKITVCEKRRIPGKGSSVDIFSVFSLWNPFSNEKGHIDHIPGKVWISWG